MNKIIAVIKIGVMRYKNSRSKNKNENRDRDENKSKSETGGLVIPAKAGIHENAMIRYKTTTAKSVNNILKVGTGLFKVLFFISIKI